MGWWDFQHWPGFEPWTSAVLCWCSTIWETEAAWFRTTTFLPSYSETLPTLCPVSATGCSSSHKHSSQCLYINTTRYLYLDKQVIVPRKVLRRSCLYLPHSTTPTVSYFLFQVLWSQMLPLQPLQPSFLQMKSSVPTTGEIKDLQEKVLATLT